MQVGRWQLDREQRTLSDGTEARALTPRSWDVLLYLLDNPGRLVRTETLLARFWRGADDETYVRKSIAEIRRALGDDARSPAYIRTVPKQGYVFLPQAAETRPGEWLGPTIAVLPFASISSEPENESFAEGISEEVLNKLTQRVPAHVVARTSSFQFKGVNTDVRSIGRSLSASHILEGSVRRAGHAVRITAQLIDAGSGAHLWSHTYQRELADVFVVQDEIASVITRAVRGALIGSARESPSESIRAVHVSRRFTDPDDFKRIVDAIRRRSADP